MVEMNEWGCRLYGGTGKLLTFVSFCDKNTGVQVICGVGYSPENMVIYEWTIYYIYQVYLDLERNILSEDSYNNYDLFI